MARVVLRRLLCWLVQGLSAQFSLDMGMDQNQATRGPQILVHPSTRVPFWIHIFDPQPYRQAERNPETFAGPCAVKEDLHFASQLKLTQDEC